MRRGSVSKFVEDGVPSVSADGELGVVEAIRHSVLSLNLEAFSNKKVLLKRRFVFIRKCSNDFGRFPFYGAGSAVACVFGNAGNVLICFGGSGVGSVLTHACTERDSCLANVLCFRCAVA